MMTRTFSLVTLLVVALLGCGAGNGTTEEKSTPAAAEKGKETKATLDASASVVSKPAVDTSQLKAAPTWTLTTLDGKPLTSDGLKGKVVLVDFWATWCGPCRQTIPHLIALHNKYKDKGLMVVGVSLDQQGPMVVRDYVAKNGISYTMAMGNQKIVADFGGVRGIPTAFIISQDGKIYSRHVGAMPGERYEQDVKALLGVS